MAQGIRFILGDSRFQALQNAAEPHLFLQQIGPVPIGVVLGLAGGGLTLVFMENKRFPAGLLVIGFGILAGICLGAGAGLLDLQAGFHIPSFLPFGFPSYADFSLALLALTLPQLPMTLGNAVVADADLSRDYFGDASRKVTYRALCVSMGIANLGSCLIGGMPLCHGAGGLAAHYRFGARTAGSNLMIGFFFVLLSLFLGPHALAILNLIPMAVLGVLLFFAGSQLALTLLDVKTRKELFVCVLMLGLTLASNLAVGFLTGIVMGIALRSDRLKI
jgi:SulP family sulfate permease